MALGNLRNRAQINNFQERICGSLHPQEASIRPNGPLQRRSVGEVGKRHVMAGRALADILQDAIAAAIEVMHRDNMRAGIQELQNGCGRGHSGGKGETCIAAFEICHGSLQGIARRVCGARYS